LLLLALCDADYCFTYVNIGNYGSTGDAGAFSASEFGRRLQHNLLNLPHDEALPNTNRPLPYVFVADDAFKLTTNMMKPYAGLVYSLLSLIFNI
jgi:hypothetical protein